MPKITNVSGYTVKVPNYAQFAPWETREVSDEAAQELLRSEHFHAEAPKKPATDEVYTNATEDAPVEEEKKTSKSKK